jgi:hypothetical protein
MPKSTDYDGTLAFDNRSLRTSLAGRFRLTQGRASLRQCRELLQQPGARLDAREKEIMRQYDQLETANNAQARREQAGAGGTFKTTRPHMIPAELHAIERIADVRERVHAIRQQRAAWRDDPKSPFNDARHPEHANHVQAMQRLYAAESELEKQPEDPE